MATACEGRGLTAQPGFLPVLAELDELAGEHQTVDGAGVIGRGVAQIGTAFGRETSLITSQRSPRDLEAAMRKADVACLHARLPHQTENMINGTSWGWLRPCVLLVNMARGALVDLNALVAALQEQRLAGAALDVLVNEPPGGSWTACWPFPT